MKILKTIYTKTAGLPVLLAIRLSLCISEICRLTQNSAEDDVLYLKQAISEEEAKTADKVNQYFSNLVKKFWANRSGSRVQI